MIFCICGAAFLETYSSTELCDIWMTDFVPNFPWDNFKNQQVGCRFPPQAARQACNHGYPSFPYPLTFVAISAPSNRVKQADLSFFPENGRLVKFSWRHTFLLGSPLEERNPVRLFASTKLFRGFDHRNFFPVGPLLNPAK